VVLKVQLASDQSARDLLRLHFQNPTATNLQLIEGSLEVKLPTIWTDEKQRWEESEKRREEKRRRKRKSQKKEDPGARESLRRKKIQVREKVGKS